MWIKNLRDNGQLTDPHCSGPVTDISTLSLPTHGCGMCPIYSRLFKFLSAAVHCFLCTNPLLPFILNYFIIFDMIVNKIIFLILFFGFVLLLVCRNATIFVLTSYPNILLDFCRIIFSSIKR